VPVSGGGLYKERFEQRVEVGVFGGRTLNLSRYTARRTAQQAWHEHRALPPAIKTVLRLPASTDHLLESTEASVRRLSR
jgi:hypothetical protein